MMRSDLVLKLLLTMSLELSGTAILSAYADGNAELSGALQDRLVDRSRVIQFATDNAESTTHSEKFCIPKTEVLVRVTGANTITSNVPANIDVMADPATNCININANLPPANKACVDEPRTVHWPFPEWRLEKHCTVVSTRVTLQVNYEVRVPFSVYLHFNAPPARQAAAQQAADSLNQAVAEHGFTTFKPDPQAYVGKRSGFPRRLVIFYWEPDRRGAVKVADIANEWIKSYGLDGPSFEIETGLTGDKGPPGSISLELWLSDP